jgi:low temperature requirement protein LtrA
LWRPPRRTADRPASRSVSFLELFYDLVYVVVISEVGHSLASQVTWAGVGEFALAFTLVWVV